MDADARPALTTTAPAKRDVDDPRFAPAEAERIAGTLMAHERLIAEGEHRGPSPPVNADDGVSHPVDASVQRMKPPDLASIPDRLGVQAKCDELTV
jgi:hypothetical protein